MHVHVVSLPEGEEVGPVKVGPVDKPKPHSNREHTCTGHAHGTEVQIEQREVAMVTRMT